MRNLILFTLFILVVIETGAQISDDQSKQKTTLTIGEVYDFGIGDEFHFTIPVGPGGSNNPNPPNAQRYIITGKTFSVNLDTVCYTRDHFDYTSGPGPGHTLQYYFNNYTSQICYTHLDSLVETLVPIQIRSLAFPLYAWTLSPKSFYCDTLVFWYQFASNANQVVNEYGRGIGHVHHMTNDMGNHPPFFHRYQLRYFSKGGVPCGTPDNTTLDIEPIATPAGSWLVYPNPVSHTMRIINPEVLNGEARLFLLDLAGRTVMDVPLAPGLQLWSIDISAVPAGQYLGRIVSHDGSSKTLRVIKR